jgi:hypothetical protein
MELLTMKILEAKCRHCYGGWVFEPTEDPLEDEAIECPACLGTARKMDRFERARIRYERELDAQWSALGRMGM